MRDPKKPTVADVKRLQSIYTSTLARYKSNKTISGVDVGYRYDNGKRTDAIAVRLHYRGEQLPRTSRGIPIPDVEIVEEDLQFVLASYDLHATMALSPRARLTEPLQPGVSVALEKGAGGTLGLIVYDMQTGKKCALSNCHIFAGLVGVNDKSSIVQPPNNHMLQKLLGDDPNVIGTLLRWIDDRDGDAAVALLNTRRKVELTQFGTSVVVKEIVAPSLGDRVQKSGASTDVTDGFIDGIGHYFTSGDTRTDGTRGMDGFRIMPLEQADGRRGTADLSAPGDSGSVWYRPDDHAGVGLHVGGDASVANPLGESAIACALETVLARLKVQVKPGK